MGDVKRRPATEAEAAWLRYRRASWVLLIVATALAFAVVAVSGGFPTWRSFWMTAGPVAVIIGIVVPLVFLWLRPKAYATPPRQERELWDLARGRVSLYAQPVTLTALAGFALAPAWLLPQGHLSWVQPYVFVLLPLSVLSTFSQILPWSWHRRLLSLLRLNFMDDLTDDLSRQHAADAFRLAAHVFAAGFVPILLTAAYAPHWVRLAAVGTLWAAAMTGTLRFGLLQRAAEGGEA